MGFLKKKGTREIDHPTPSSVSFRDYKVTKDHQCFWFRMIFRVISFSFLCLETVFRNSVKPLCPRMTEPQSGNAANV